MSVHLSTPANPRVAACGAKSARTLTFWRWKCDCKMCLAITAPRAFDATHASTIGFRADIPIRYSKLVAYVRAQSRLPNVEEAIAEFERDRANAGSFCPTCKATLPDPVALFDVEANRMVFACPACSSEPVRKRWESEA